MALANSPADITPNGQSGDAAYDPFAAFRAITASPGDNREAGQSTVFSATARAPHGSDYIQQVRRYQVDSPDECKSGETVIHVRVRSQDPDLPDRRFIWCETVRT
jgi:hypothetical protein